MDFGKRTYSQIQRLLYGKIYEINPKIDNTFWDTYYKRGFSSGDFILLDGELPDKWKGKSHHEIFKKNVKL